MRQRWTKLGIVTAVNVVLLVLLIAVQFLVGESRPFTTLLTYLPQHGYCLPTLVLLGVLLVRRRWRLLAWQTPAVMLCVFVLLGVNIPLPRGGQGEPIRVMTCNVHQLSHGVEDVARAIEREHPDIVFLQEVNAPRTYVPSTALRRRLKDWHYAGAVEVAIFSRHPIIAQRAHPIPLSHRMVQEAVIDLRGKTITAVCMHMSVGTNQGTIFRPRGTRNEYLRRTADVRARQVDVLLDIVEQSPNPVIIAGDFNTPPRGRLYLRLRRHLTDAFAAAGWGPGYTYPARLPLMRIDYIWHTPDFTTTRCVNPPTTPSDHYPVIAELRWR